MSATPLSVILLDPSLFTAPYDAALNAGLRAAGVRTTWLTRPPRPGEPEELAPGSAQPVFYKHVDRWTRLPAPLRAAAKGLSHLGGLLRLIAQVAVERPDAVHFQWAVVPLFDSLAMRVVRWFAPVVLTVHDTVPFNGEYVSWWQNAGFTMPIRAADRVIVHTARGREHLIAAGIDAARISVVPHGPLPLRGVARTGRPADDARYTFLLFGEIKPYKGVDVLVEALARLPAEVRRRGRWIIAGRPRMDLTPIEDAIERHQLSDCVDLRPQRQSDDELAELFACTDCLLFPYRQIDASGVWYLTKSLGKWMIASRVGVFADELVDPAAGQLLTPESPQELADALRHAVETRAQGRPMAGNDWTSIATRTVEIYRDAARPPGQPRKRPMPS